MKSLMSKQTKSRLLSVLLLVVMLTAMLPVNAMAGNGIVVTASTATLDDNGYATVEISVSNNTEGIGVMQIVAGGTTGLKLTNRAVPTALGGTDEGSVKNRNVVWICDHPAVYNEETEQEEVVPEPFVGDGVIATFKFKPETGAYGKIAVPFTVTLSSYDEQVYCKNASYTGYVQLPSVTVTFDNNGHGGDAPAAQEMAVNGKASAPTNPSDENWIFDGWYTEATGGTKWDFETNTVAADTTLYAHWVDDSPVTLSYSSNDTNMGTVSSDSESVKRGTGTAVGSTASAKSGYDFVGWYKGETSVGTAANFVPTKNGNVYETASYVAKFEAHKTTVTLNAGEGTCSESSVKAPYGTNYSLPTPTRTGYTFDGWYTAAEGGTKVTNETKVTNSADHTLYAHWTAETYEVTFDSNEGALDNNKVNVTYDAAYGTLPTPTRAGYKFDGWYTEKTGGTKITAETKVTFAGNDTLYAHWTGISYSVSFNSNNTSATGSMDTQTGFVYGTEKALSKNAFELKDYKFTGWATSSKGSVVYNDGVSVTDLTTTDGSTVTLYAVWAEKGAIVIDEKAQEFTYGDSNIAFEVKVKDPADTKLTGFTVEYKVGENYTTKAPTAAGKYDVKVTRAKDETYKAFEKTITDGLVINQKEVTLTWAEPENLVYDKEEKVPGVAIASGVLQGDDCGSSAQLNSENDNINVGTFTYTATLKGDDSANYVIKSSDVTASYTIKALPVEISWDYNKPFTYDSKEKAVTPTVSNIKSGDNLVLEVTGNKKTDADKYTASVTGISGTSSSNYSLVDATGLTQEFVINPAELKASMLTLSDNVTYNGTKQEPTVTVKDGTTPLTLTTDYTVSYGTGDYKAAGEYTVSVTGTGNYTGTVSKNFEIKAKDGSTCGVVTLTGTPYTYTGAEIKPRLTVVDTERQAELVEGTDYTVDFENNISAGTAKYTIKFKGNYKGTKADNFTIFAKDVTKVDSGVTVASIADQTYTGNEIKPTLTVKDGTVELKENTDYTIESYENNTNVGTATVNLEFKGNYTGTKSATFKIVKASLTITVEAGQSKEYGDADPIFVYTVSGLAKADESKSLSELFVGSLSRKDALKEDVGSYQITIGDLKLNSDGNYDKNYEIKHFVTCNFTIEPNEVIKGSEFTEEKAQNIEFKPENVPVGTNPTDPVVKIKNDEGSEVTLKKDVNYTVDEDGTVTILSSTLDTYGAGTYTVTFSYKSTVGENLDDIVYVAESTFTVKADTSKNDVSEKTDDKTDKKGAKKDDKPAGTGDDATPVLFAVIVLVCAAALVTLLVVRKKRNSNKG